LICGVPSQSGTFNFVVTVTIGAQSDSEELSLTVNFVGPEEPLPNIGRSMIWNGQQLRTFATADPPTVTRDLDAKQPGGVAPKDIWVDATGRLCVITATSPTVTYDCYAKQSEAGGTSLNRESHYFNVTHSRIVSNVPVAGEDLSIRTRGKKDLSGFTEVRFHAYITGHAAPLAGQVIRLEYSTDGGTVWAQIDGGTGTQHAVDTGHNTFKSTGWLTMAVAARVNNVLIRAFVTPGNDTVDPDFGIVYAEFR
jgi:hypothetical protein